MLRTGGELVLWRRPQQNDQAFPSDYRPCPHCLAFVTKAEMWRHIKTCKFIDGDDGETKTALKKSNIILYSNQYSKGATLELTEMILEKMNNDSVSTIVKGDELITTYGSFLFSSKGSRNGVHISQRLRLLARLLEVLPDKKTLLDLIDPTFFDAIVDGVKILGQFSMECKEGQTVPVFKKPSLPIKMGHCIDQCAELVKGIAIKSNNEELLTRAERFSKIFNLEWEKKVSSISLRCLDDNKFDKVQLLPITDDLMLVRKYLKDNIPSATRELEINPSVDTWRTMAEITAIRLTMLNRRRISEVFGMLLSKFNKRNENKNAEMDEIKDSLTPLEKRLLSR